MGYLINSCRPTSLTIGSNEYIENLIDFQVQDSSGYRNGIITTTGSITLGSNPGDNFEDYDRNDFRRGQAIRLHITHDDGTTELHPRGYLYVISTSYDPEAESILLDVGCRLVMTKLLDDENEILSLIQTYADIPLDPAQEDFESLSASIATSAKVLWSDRSNALQTQKYFGTDNYGTYETEEFTCVRGVTALQVQPLAAAAAIPDEIELSYSYPVGETTKDNRNRVDSTTTTSNYFLRYPAITYERQPPDGGLAGNINLSVPPVTIPPIPIPASGCGNTPSPPAYSPATSSGGGTASGSISLQIPAKCSDNYTTVATPVYVPAKRTEIRDSFYSGPAAQMSSQESKVYGPALEANSQYYADSYAYCTGVYANQCLPSGGCELMGLHQILLGRQITVYEYGSGGEVLKTTTSTYRPTLAAAQPDDWRSGTNRGIPQDFQTLDETTEYLHQVVIREFSQSSNENVQTTTTFTSVASRGGGVGANLDAYHGIETKEIRRSTTNVTKDLRPDNLNSATTSVDTETTRVQMHGQVGGYESSFGPYVVKEDAPVPILLESASAVDSVVDGYGDYLARFIEGDARGLVVAESLRKEIVANWRPNVPFRYYDPKSDKLMAFRADACAWGVNLDGCVVVMNGIWVGDLSGTVNIGSNLLGNATPDMSGANDPTPPTHGVTPPTVSNQQVINKRFNFFVKVPISLGITMTPSGANGVRPVFDDRYDVTSELSIVVWCTAQIVQPGALVALDNDGSIPVDFVGNPVVDENLVIQEDIFGTTNNP